MVVVVRPVGDENHGPREHRGRAADRLHGGVEHELGGEDGPQHEVPALHGHVGGGQERPERAQEERERRQALHGAQGPGGSEFLAVRFAGGSRVRRRRRSCRVPVPWSSTTDFSTDGGGRRIACFPGGGGGGQRQREGGQDLGPESVEEEQQAADLEVKGVEA